jgi:hypothetical protein
MGQLKELPELPEGLSWRRGAKKPVIYAIFRCDGKQVWRSTGTSDVKRAQAIQRATGGSRARRPRVLGEGAGQAPDDVRGRDEAV